jgi:hypothetical protein
MATFATVELPIILPDRINDDSANDVPPGNWTVDVQPAFVPYAVYVGVPTGAVAFG